jgi:hypothetical protein
MTTVDKQKKLETMVIGNLPDLISNILGYDIKINHIIFKNGYIDFKSQDLTEHTGVMKNFYESFYIGPFSNNFTSDNDDIYWVNLSFRFTYKTGGSNGHSIGDVYYNFKTKTWYTLD